MRLKSYLAQARKAQRERRSSKYQKICFGATKLNFRQPQSRKLFSSRFINTVHLAHAPIIAEQNDLECVLYPLSVLAAPSTDRQTPIL